MAKKQVRIQPWVSASVPHVALAPVKKEQPYIVTTVRLRPDQREALRKAVAGLPNGDVSAVIRILVDDWMEGK
jgi:hypothetical protein